ncbi:membrane protein [Micromonospora pisi]|uniref:Membrane protein n=1 Tax=Micromonospora pisi TaxID=589240 RepID=A0A495JKR6_9ACTN|nr:YihY/virulence factor BrkB family protein [Micromonospora pisi]RKR88619.1 membrane protein [Micromonospora pisi]
MNLLDRVVGRAERRVRVWRGRSPVFDHFCRAVGRYVEVLGGRLAAGIAYYGFFAVFALGLVAYWIFGAVLGESQRVNEGTAHFFRQNLPFLDPEQIQQGSRRVGIIGLVLLVITGIGWVEAIRSSQRLVYRLNQQPGYVVIRQLIDLVVVLGVFLLLGISVGAVDTLQSLLRLAIGSHSVLVSITSWVLALVINVVLATALMLAVPRLRITPRRLFSPVLLVALGVTLLNSVGRYYVIRFERNLAYTAVAGTVGLLVYLYLLNQLLLFGAALAATSHRGRVIDLAADDPPAPGPPRVGEPR